jgi:hypothetical protein
MKYLFLISVFFMSCTSNKSTNSNLQQNNQDTLVINNKAYFLDSISEKEYNTVLLKMSEDKSVENEIIEDTNNVSRDKLKLTFHLKNESDSILVNDTTQDFSDFVNYCYLESNKDIDYWLVKVQLYEGGGYLLINKENGNKIWIWSKPVFSPDKKHFVSYSCDLEAGYLSNGIQLFEVKNREVFLLWEKEIDEWGPSELKWKNDSTIYIEKLKLDFNDSKNPDKISYKSMKIL